jgi:hypothetical protein
LLGIVVIPYTLVLAEAYFRVFAPQALMPRYITGTPWGVRGNIPNARYWNHTREVDVEYRINGQGLRADRNFAVAKPPGVCRVAIFGDSFFFGVELDLPQSYAGQLEARLRQAGYPVEVLNFSVGGFGTAEMLQTFEGFGRSFSPDVVIFSWDNSDLQDNERSALYRIDSGELVKSGISYLPGVKTLDWLMQFRLYRAIADHSEFYSFIREKAALLVKRQMQGPRAEAAESDNSAQHVNREIAGSHIPGPPRDPKTLELSTRILLRAKHSIEAQGADFYLVEIPYKLSRTEFTSGVEVLPAAVRSQLNVVYTTAALSRAARPDLKLFYETGQGHLTPIGMSILVDATVRQLVLSKRLAACAAESRHSGTVEQLRISGPKGDRGTSASAGASR